MGKATEDDDRCFARVVGAGPSSTTGSDRLSVRSSRTAIELWSEPLGVGWQTQQFAELWCLPQLGRGRLGHFPHEDSSTVSSNRQR